MHSEWPVPQLASRLAVLYVAGRRPGPWTGNWSWPGAGFVLFRGGFKQLEA